MEIRLRVGLSLNFGWRQIREISNERGELLELSESKPAERHESKVSGTYSDDLWFWDLQQNLTNRGCGCYLYLVRGNLRHMLLSVFVQTLRRHINISLLRPRMDVALITGCKSNKFYEYRVPRG